MATRDLHWKQIRHEGAVYFRIGRNADGTYWNPKGYPDEIVREAVDAAEARWRARLSESAKRAAKTRAERKERLVYEIVARLKTGGALRPGTHCECCGKGLGDPESKARGIGSDCWQEILRRIDGRAEATA